MISTSRSYDLLQKRPIKIRLKTDLTRYHPELKPGTEGTTRFEEAQWGCWCWFDKAGRWDIIMNEGVEIIDEEYNRLKALDEEDKWESLKKATNVELHLGPNGGFQCLSYKVGNASTSNGFRSEGMKLLEFFRAQRIPVREIRQPRR